MRSVFQKQKKLKFDNIISPISLSIDATEIIRSTTNINVFLSQFIYMKDTEMIREDENLYAENVTLCNDMGIFKKNSKVQMFHADLKQNLICLVNYGVNINYSYSPTLITVLTPAAPCLPSRNDKKDKKSKRRVLPAKVKIIDRYYDEEKKMYMYKCQDEKTSKTYTIRYSTVCIKYKDELKRFEEMNPKPVHTPNYLNKKKLIQSSSEDENDEKKDQPKKICNTSDSDSDTINSDQKQPVFNESASEKVPTTISKDSTNTFSNTISKVSTNTISKESITTNTTDVQKDKKKVEKPIDSKKQGKKRLYPKPSESCQLHSDTHTLTPSYSNMHPNDQDDKKQVDKTIVSNNKQGTKRQLPESSGARELQEYVKRWQAIHLINRTEEETDDDE
jgi:hypothetical protein